jgi:two-component system, OmpR family, sensor histidine kinase MtrB
MALSLSVLLSGLTWVLVSHYLLDQRESSAWVETSDNAAALKRSLRPGEGEIPTLLDGLLTNAGDVALLRFQGEWYSTSLTKGPANLPTALTAEVASGTASSQRIAVDGQPFLAVGMPLGGEGDAFLELFPLSDLDRTYHVLSLALVAVAAATAVLGLAVGRLASKRALSPLTKLTHAAAAIAQGDLSARVREERDPDLLRLARSFNSTADALQRRVEADARFAGDVSHELRTPLTTMLNSMQLVRNRHDELPQSVWEPVELLAVDLERFRRLVVNLLEISRDDGGDRRARENVLIGDLVRRAADAAAGRAVTRIDPDVAELRMRADKRRLEQVVMNLVDNAEGHGNGCTEVFVSADDGRVVVTVDDAGSGVPLARRERIFERFSKGQGGGNGVGLGLAIVARHVLWHRGTIQVQDRPGGGARFVLDLPLDGSDG